MTSTRELLAEAKKKIADAIPAEILSDDAAKKILQRYSAAIEGNFVAWMGTAAITARSVQGRYAASENLWVEMKDDHAGMLRAFAKNAGSEPSLEDYQGTEEAVQNVREMVGEMSGLKNLTLMAVLENSSAVFVPWLATLGKQLGATDFTYTDIHGEADIMHADQFTWAVEHEAEHYANANEDIGQAAEVAAAFLAEIFQAR